jgi:hypothetical protein
MCPTPQEHIAVQFPRLNQQAIAITLRNDGMTVGESDSEVSVRDNLVQGHRSSFDIEISLDNLNIGTNTTEKVPGFLVGKVT